MKTTTTIRSILNEMIQSIKDEESNLKSAFANYCMDEPFILEDEEDRDYYMDAVNQNVDVTLEHFEPSEMMKILYNQKIENIEKLKNYTLKLYSLYNDRIDYLEKMKDDKQNEIKIANEKELINQKEFTLLFGYSESAQKGFRRRLNNPIPFIQKGIGTKIFYNRKQVTEWLKQKK